MSDFYLVGLTELVADTKNNKVSKKFRPKHITPGSYSYQHLRLIYRRSFVMNRINFKFDSAYPLEFANGLNDSLKINLYNLSCIYNISQKNKYRKSPFFLRRTNIRFDKDYSINLWALSVADIIKIHYFVTKGKKEQPYKKLHKIALKFRQDGRDGNVMGTIVESTIVKLNKLKNDMSGLTKILNSKVIMGNDFHMKIGKGETLDYLADAVFNQKYEDVVKRVHNYVFNNVPLYNSTENVVHFDEPITMAELRKMLEKNDRDHFFFCKIFKKLTKEKAAELEEYGVLKFDHKKFTEDNVPVTYPVWAYRKFVFTSINLDSAMYTIAEIVKDALWRQKVRKRHKNNKKNYFRNVRSNGGWHLEGDCNKFWSIGKNYNHKRRNENKRIIKDQCF